MRGLTRICALLLLLNVLRSCVWAEDPAAEIREDIHPEVGLSSELVDRIGSYDGAIEGFGDKLLHLLGDTLGRVKELHLQQALASVGMILASALLCALFEDSEGGRSLAPLVGTLTITAACTRPMDAMITLGADVIRDLCQYCGLLLPTMSTLLTASGNLSATAVASFGMLLLEGLLALVSGLMVPLLYTLPVLAVAEYGLGMKNLGQLSAFVKWLLVTMVKGILYAYSAILTFTGVVSGSVDAQRLRSVRSVVAGMVPVVGNIVSDASGSLLSAASTLKTAVGLYGMLAVFGLCL
ncbi:MAG: hypothetical protein IIY70_04130, partial [Oscillospiraceae bacterium]|nr:hypothetical protein [Oscillospiraceae bacterium]